MQSQTQRGSALIVGLIFLLVLTVLGTAGMRMARFEIMMAGDEQFYAQAINAAESAIEVQIAEGQFRTEFTDPSNPVSANTPDSVSGTSTLQYLNQGMAPDGGFSDDVMTYRFRIDANGQAPGGPSPRADVRVRQGLYILAPGGA